MDYEKILKGIVQIINTAENSDIGFANICDYIDENCPELKESEDEKIRKWLIGYFNQYIIDGMPQVFGNGLNVKDVLAWLEKQGDKYETIWKPTKEQINALTHFVRSVGESGYTSPYDNNTKLLYSLLTDLQVLEKQGENDSQVIYPTFTFNDILAVQCCMETVKEVQEDKELYEQLQSLHNRLHDIYWLEKQSTRSEDNEWISLIT